MDLQSVIAQIADQVHPAADDGEVASYIKPLAEVPADRFGMSITTVEGEHHSIGDAAEPFSIQSIVKLYTLAVALDREGDKLWSRVGRGPSGNPFNSLVQLEFEEGYPRNPFINSGAVVVVDILLDHCDPVAELTALLRELGGDLAIDVDDAVAVAEVQSADRNRALVHYLRSFFNLTHDPEQVLETYCRLCSIAMSCDQLARAGLFLANGGVDPASGRQVVARNRAKYLNALMTIAGTYSGVGDVAYRVGLPCKSGVGGGIVAILPGRYSACVWSPALTHRGNSAAGLRALELLTTLTGESVF